MVEKDGAWLNDAKIAAGRDADGNTLPLKVEADGTLNVVLGSVVAPMDVIVDNIVPVSQSGTWTVNLAASPVIDIGTVDQGTGGSSAWKVDGSAVTQPVSLTSTTITGSVAVTGPLTDTQLRLTAVPVSGTFFQGTQPVSLATAPTTPVTGTFFQATQPVSGTVTANAGSGTLLVDGSAHTQPVSGSISVSNFPATQPVSGTITANQGTSPWVTSLTSTTITGNVTVAQATGTNLHVVVDSAPSTAVTGTVAVSNFPATQPISGAITEANVDKNFGTWAYYAGSSGTVSVTAGQRILGIGAHATTAGSLTINGGASVTIPAGVSFNLSPLGNITAPTIVFTGTDSYFIEVVS